MDRDRNKKKPVRKPRPDYKKEDRWWRPEMTEEEALKFREFLITTGQLTPDDGERADDGRPFMKSVLAVIKARLIRTGILTPKHKRRW